MSKCLYCQTELPEGYGMVCSSCEKDLPRYLGGCRKCLHFTYCEDKKNQAYCGCKLYFKHKSEYVKVVRCKNCKHFGADRASCIFHGIDVEADDFCSYGEREK